MAQYRIAYRTIDGQTGAPILDYRKIEANSLIDARDKATNFGIPSTEISNISVLPDEGSLGTPFIGDQTLEEVQAMRTDTGEEGSFGRTADMFKTQAGYKTYVDNVAKAQEEKLPTSTPQTFFPEIEDTALPSELTNVIKQSVKGMKEGDESVSVFRKLIGQKRSSGGNLYRLYAYGLSEEQINEVPEEFQEKIAFLVEGGSEFDYTQAYNNEVAVTPKAYENAPNILELTANDIIGYGTNTQYFRNGGKNTDFITLNAFARKNDKEKAKIPDWYKTVNELNSRAVTESTTEDGNIVYSFTAQQAEGGGSFGPDSFKPPTEIEDPILNTSFEENNFGGQPTGPIGTDSSKPIISKKIEEKEIVDVAGAGGSMGEILSGYGIDVGPFGVIADDMPGLPPDFFERDDYYVDVTTVTRDVNPLFNRIEDTYQTSDAGFRIDSSGQPEYLESIKIEREINPEISAALEAYKYALEAKTSLSGSLAQVLSTHINATDGLGVGADAFTPDEIANFRQNVALISATEGLVTYDKEGERQIDKDLQQARIGEITAAQRPDVLQQLTNIYSNPVAYGILQQTEEGKSFLNNLQQQATFTPFGQQQTGVQNIGMGTQLQNNAMNPLGTATNLNPLSGGTGYVPPSARDYSTAGELEQGMMIADAASNNILGQRALESEIQERTPFGTNLTESYLAPFTTKRSRESDPFAGAVTAGGS